MSTAPKIKNTFYISTGKLNARYTLRMFSTGEVVNNILLRHDNYVCNLADSLELAQIKAQSHFERLTAHYGDSITSSLILDPDYLVDSRMGILSMRDTQNIEKIENGIFPFGKHIDTPIDIAPDQYILFFADMLGKDENAVTQCLAAACAGVACERELFKKREAKIEARLQRDLASQFVGEIKERLEFTGVIEIVHSYETAYGWNTMYSVRCGDNVVVYRGTAVLGEKGDQITMMATIKAHDTYKDIKQTHVSRPKVTSVVTEAA